MQSVDICIIIHCNYDLYDCQREHWDWIEGKHRLLFADNTPAPVRKQIKSDGNLFIADCGGTDGETHGATLDLLIRETKTPIIGICDSDFFWMKKSIIEEVILHFNKGCRCVGVEHFYNDFAKVNKLFPDRASHLAPSTFGMFIDRELALSETFIATRHEGVLFSAEGGWRIRKKIITEKIPCHVYRAFQYPENPDPEIYYFGTPGNPVGVHLLKGSIFRTGDVTAARRTAMSVAQEHISWELPL